MLTHQKTLLWEVENPQDTVLWIKKYIKLKPWLLSKIVDTQQELEGFTYASQLDLNMGMGYVLCH